MSTLGDGDGNVKIVVEANQLLQMSNVHLNVGQDLIVVTEDKFRLCLGARVDKLARRHAWIAPAGLLVSFVTALATSTFHEFLLGKDVWKSLFILCSVASGIWLVFALIAFRSAPSLDDLVTEIKKGALAAPETRVGTKGA